MSTKKKRFTEEEAAFLKDLLQGSAEIVDNKTKTDAITPQIKKAEWTRLAKEFNSVEGFSKVCKTFY